MELLSFDTTRLQSLESAQFINSFLKNYKKKYPDLSTDVQFEEIYAELVQKAPVYANSVKQTRAKVESLLIIELDLKRRQKTSTVFWALKVYTHTDDPLEKKAFTALKVLTDEFYDLKKPNLESRTLSIDILIANLRSPKYLPHCQLLGLEKHIDHLETANETFKTTFNVRASRTIKEQRLDSAALRLDIFKTYKDLCEYVEIMAKRKKGPFYEEVLKIINYGRQYYGTLVAKRKGVAKARIKRKKVSETATEKPLENEKSPTAIAGDSEV